MKKKTFELGEEVLFLYFYSPLHTYIDICEGTITAIEYMESTDKYLYSIRSQRGCQTVHERFVFKSSDIEKAEKLKLKFGAD